MANRKFFVEIKECTGGETKVQVSANSARKALEYAIEEESKILEKLEKEFTEL